MNSKLKKWNSLTLVGLVNLLLLSGFFVVSTACTSTAAKPANQEEPLDPSLTEDPEIFGSIDEDNAQYQWADKQYGDKRFASELENSPLRPYEPRREDPWVADGKTGSSVEKSQTRSSNKIKKLRKKSKKSISGTQVR